jgi:hypothetical protein
MVGGAPEAKYGQPGYGQAGHGQPGYGQTAAATSNHYGHNNAATNY